MREKVVFASYSLSILFILNVLTDNGAKTFFPREECVIQNCNLNPFLGSTSKYNLLIKLFLQILQGGKTLATRIVNEVQALESIKKTLVFV